MPNRDLRIVSLEQQNVTERIVANLNAVSKDVYIENMQVSWEKEMSSVTLPLELPSVVDPSVKEKSVASTDYLEPMDTNTYGPVESRGSLLGVNK